MSFLVKAVLNDSFLYGIAKMKQDHHVIALTSQRQGSRRPL